MEIDAMPFIQLGGVRAVLVADVERYPDGTVRAGHTGTLRVEPDYVALDLDDAPAWLDRWKGSLHFYVDHDGGMVELLGSVKPL